MADRTLALPGNAPGAFFVDRSCIDCDACRWIAPTVFDQHQGQSRVRRQPAAGAEHDQALLALIACPTHSIGVDAPAGVAAAQRAFPRLVTGPVHHCGWHHQDSFGAASWLLLRPDGNVLVDSPRFAAPLVARLEALGGVRWMFLTHRDDVADHDRFARHFGCTRVLHEGDLDGVRAIEHVITGTAPVRLAPDLLVLPVPGHTRGSACLLAGQEHLFSGDHLAWDPVAQRLHAFDDACWFDWRAQTRSMATLVDQTFAWVFPGHGRLVHLPPQRMRAELQRCVAWMATR